MGSTVKAKDLIEWHPVQALSACDTWTIATIEANPPLLLSVVTALPYPSRTHHQSQYLEPVLGAQFPNNLKPYELGKRIGGSVLARTPWENMHTGNCEPVVLGTEMCV